jgi:hypothetical protein
MIQSKLKSSHSLVAGLLIFTIACSGCSSYGRVSPASYDFAMAMYSISNTKSADKLPTFEQKLAEAKQGGTLTAQEAQWLEEILESARAGEWQSAALASRAMMAEQASR